MSLFTMTLQRREMFFSVLYSLNALCSSPPLISETVVSSIAQGIATWFQCSRYMRW